MRALSFDGQDFRVNQFGRSDQGAPNVAANPLTGGFQVVWESDGQDGDGWGVFARNFSAAGQASGGDIAIADMTVGDQRTPDVALDADGNGMWVWSTTAIYNSAASNPEEPSVANTFPAANFRTSSKTFGFEEEPGSTADYRNSERLRDGGWDDDPVGKDAIEPSVISIGGDMFINGWYRKDEDRAEYRYAVDQVSADFNAVISANGDYSRGFAEAETVGRIFTNFGDVALLRTVDDRRFGDLREMLVVSTLASSRDAQDGVIQFQIFQESPSAGSAFLYGSRLQTDYNERFVLEDSGLTGDASRPRVAVLEDGGFAIVWMEQNQTAANPDRWHSDVHVQVFGDDLAAVGPRIAVHNSSRADQEMPEIAATRDGGFVITWTDNGGGGNGGTVMAQRFDASGVRLDNARMVDAGGSGQQSDSAIARLANDDLVIAWQAASGDGNGAGVRARILETENYGPAVAQSLVGTDAAERFFTRAGADTVDGGGGADVLNGGPGADRLQGSIGNDRLLGGKGPDGLFGGGGRDTLAGGRGNDTLDGDRGVDVLRGGGGDDLARADGGNDRAEGGGGNDTLLGNRGADTLGGGPGADVVVGGQGGDRLLGNKGADRILDGGGRDIMSGGPGADTFVLNRDAFVDRITDWGVGNDRLDLSAYDASHDLQDVGKRQAGNNVDVLVDEQVVVRLMDVQVSDFNIQVAVEGL